MKRTTRSWCSALLALAACQAGVALAADAQWRTSLLGDHRLVGRIWDVAAAREITRDELLAHLARSRITLLGEIHDNEDHHRLQAEVHNALTTSGAQPALVMEQFDLDHQKAIDAARAAPLASAQTVAAAGKMREAWRPEYYAPLIEHAIDVGTPVVAANLSREAAREVMREGFAALGPGRAQQLALEQAWDAGREQRLRREIIAGHCGQVQEDRLPGLAAAQRARDALMADVLLGYAASGAVGIVGRGHARRDIGIPRYLGQRQPALSLVTVGLIEVEAERQQVAEYLDAYPGFDYLWFTPRAQRKDPCAGFSMPQAR